MCSVRSKLFRYYTGDRSPIQLLITMIPFAVKLMFSQHLLSSCRCVYNRNRQLYMTWNALCHWLRTNRYSPCHNCAIALSIDVAHSSITNAESIRNSSSVCMKMRNGWKTKSASNCCARSYYPEIFFLLARQPPVGHGLLIHEVSFSKLHTTTHYSR
jgi:hypothetical protein